MLAIAAMGILLLSSEVPVTAVGTEQAVVRGASTSGWVTLEYTNTWYAGASSSSIFVQNTDPTTDTISAPRARFVLRGGEDLCYVTDCTSWPQGTVTSTVSVDGISSTLYAQPVFTDTGGTHGSGFIDITHSSAGPGGSDDKSFIELAVSDAEDVSEYDDLAGMLDDIVDSVDFIPQYVTTGAWSRSTRTGMKLLTALSNYMFYHPAGWSVTETTTDVTVANASSPYESIEFVPSRPSSEWDNATPLLGSNMVRLISDQTASGVRTVVYSVQHVQPIKVTAQLPAASLGTAQYWGIEQTVWAVIHEAFITYDSSVWAYP